MSPETQALHQQLIRLAKGMLRAWETWLLLKTPPPSATKPEQSDK